MKISDARAELEELKKELTILDGEVEEEEEDLSEYIDDDADNARYMAMALNLLDYVQTWLACNLKKQHLRLAMGEARYDEMLGLIDRVDKFIADYDLKQLDGGDF